MEKTDYLDISDARDIKNKKERRLYRLFEMLPGLLSFGTLIGVLVFSWLIPGWVAIFIIAFCFYYLFRIFYFSLHQIVGYAKVRNHMKKDWLAELKKIRGKNWQNIYHVVLLPTYKESEKIIKESLDSLVDSKYPKEKIIVVLSVEERAGREYQEAAYRLAQQYSNTFFKFIAVTHPASTPGEMAGKGSNSAFAGQEAQKLIDGLGLSYENVLISNFDIDTKAYPQYFACLTWYYLTEKNPLRASYQPVPVYNNNIWKATFFARVVSSSNTFWQMIQQERSEKLTTYSSHAIPAKVFFEVGYPHNVVCDDSRIFWRAYLHYDGDYRVVPMYYMLSMDAVDTTNSFKTIINQYKQQKRWAWGCAEIPYVMFGFLQNKNIPFSQKASHIYTLVDGYWSWATASLLLFALGWLPIFLGGSRFNVTVLSFNLPILTSKIMTFSLVGMLISAMLSTMILPPLPEGVSRFKKFAIFLQWIFLPITLIIFGAFPALDAQARLMLGRYMGFWVTEKRR
ncbi:glycosyltransferase family 2 protein [Candidatus Parcubacteria bacterium]|nr:glycosyltransferase family 2 protein [Candidatus Parcubacteria bacterium]